MAAGSADAATAVPARPDTAGTVDGAAGTADAGTAAGGSAGTTATGPVLGRRDVLDGPFTTRQLFRLDEALRAADEQTGLTFSVYTGPLDEPTREHAQRLLGQLDDPAGAVLLAVSPNQRVLEIVTGEQARSRLPDRICALAALSMTAAFSGGDLPGGIVTGIAMLANQSRG